MSNQRILITLRADREVGVRHEALVRRAQDAGRSVNTQMLLELGYIDEQTADSIPRVGRYSRVLRHTPGTFADFPKFMREATGQADTLDSVGRPGQ